MLTPVSGSLAGQNARTTIERRPRVAHSQLTALPDERTGLLVGGLAGLKNSNRNDPAQLRKVAAEFESLLIEQMLKFARQSSPTDWLGGDGDKSGSTMAEVAEQQLARAIAAGGGLGLADLIVSGLTKKR